jgi:hypothetical protein
MHMKRGNTQAARTCTHELAQSHIIHPRTPAIQEQYTASNPAQAEQQQRYAKFIKGCK